MPFPSRQYYRILRKLKLRKPMKSISLRGQRKRKDTLRKSSKLKVITRWQHEFSTSQLPSATEVGDEFSLARISGGKNQFEYSERATQTFNMSIRVSIFFVSFADHLDFLRFMMSGYFFSEPRHHNNTTRNTCVRRYYVTSEEAFRVISQPPTKRFPCSSGKRTMPLFENTSDRWRRPKKMGVKHR